LVFSPWFGASAPVFVFVFFMTPGRPPRFMRFFLLWCRRPEVFRRRGRRPEFLWWRREVVLRRRPDVLRRWRIEVLGWRREVVLRRRVEVLGWRREVVFRRRVEVLGWRREMVLRRRRIEVLRRRRVEVLRRRRIVFLWWRREIVFRRGWTGGRTELAGFRTFAAWRRRRTWWSQGWLRLVFAAWIRSRKHR